MIGKCLEIVLLLYNLHIFTPEQIMEESNKTVFFSCFFGATFEKIWLKKASFDLFEQLFEKSQATCGKHQNITIANQSINNSRLSFLEEGKGGGC